MKVGSWFPLFSRRSLQRTFRSYMFRGLCTHKYCFVGRVGGSGTAGESGLYTRTKQDMTRKFRLVKLMDFFVLDLGSGSVRSHSGPVGAFLYVWVRDIKQLTVFYQRRERSQTEQNILHKWHLLVRPRIDTHKHTRCLFICVLAIFKSVITLYSEKLAESERGYRVVCVCVCVSYYPVCAVYAAAQPLCVYGIVCGVCLRK